MALEKKSELKTCGACGDNFECGAHSGSCWCQGFPILGKVTPGSDCLCPSCLKKAAETQSREKIDP